MSRRDKKREEKKNKKRKRNRKKKGKSSKNRRGLTRKPVRVGRRTWKDPFVDLRLQTLGYFFSNLLRRWNPESPAKDAVVASRVDANPKMGLEGGPPGTTRPEWLDERERVLGVGGRVFPPKTGAGGSVFLFFLNRSNILGPRRPCLNPKHPGQGLPAKGDQKVSTVDRKKNRGRREATRPTPAVDGVREVDVEGLPRSKVLAQPSPISSCGTATTVVLEWPQVGKSLARRKKNRRSTTCPSARPPFGFSKGRHPNTPHCGSRSKRSETRNRPRVHGGCRSAPDFVSVRLYPPPRCCFCFRPRCAKPIRPQRRRPVVRQRPPRSNQVRQQYGLPPPSRTSFSTGQILDVPAPLTVRFPIRYNKKQTNALIRQKEKLCFGEIIANGAKIGRYAGSGVG